MKVDDPQFTGKGGTIDKCINCPINELSGACAQYINGRDGMCPHRYSYDEACKFAEKINN